MIDISLCYKKDPKIAEAMSVYSWLEENKHNKKDRLLHFFLFKNFYRIENGGLTDQWKLSFSEKLYESLDNQRNLDLKEFVKYLYQFRNLKGQKTFQFSFATKAIALIDKEKPIYDSEVEKAFGWNNLYYIKNFDKRIESYINRYFIIENTYNEFLVKYEKEIKTFKEVYSFSNIHEIKILDTLVWRTQKLSN